MLKKLLVVGAVALAAAAGAVAVALFAPEESAQANSPMAPVSVEVEFVEAVAAPLQIDHETGLPKGAVMFQAGDHTCVALANGTMECFCPCETGPCLEVSTAVVTSTLEISATVPFSTSIPADIPEDDGDDDETDVPPEEEPEEDPSEAPSEDPSEDPSEEPEEDDDDEAEKGKGNNGHGNNEDGVDCSNPGKGKGGPNGKTDESYPEDDEKKKPKKGK